MSKSKKKYFAKLFCDLPYSQFLDSLKNPQNLSLLETEFPVHLFPDEISDLIVECGEKVPISKDFIGGAIISVLGYLCHGFQVEYKNGAFQTSNIWMALIGESGSGKSPAIDYAIEPLEQYDKQNYQKVFEESKNTASDNKRMAKQSIAKDVTLEMLTQLLFTQGSIIDIKDELQTWKEGMMRYSNTSQESTYLEIWNGKSIRYNRKTNSQDIRVDRSYYCLLGGLQNELVKEFFSKRSQVNGLAARFLFVYPERIDIRVSNEEVPINVLLGYQKLVEQFLHIQKNTDEQHTRILKFSQQALVYLNLWREKVTIPILNNSEVSKNVHRSVTKMELYVQRFSLIFELLGCVCNRKQTSAEISLDSVKRSIMLADYFMVNTIKVLNLVEGTQTQISQIESEISKFIIEQYKDSNTTFDGAVRKAIDKGYRPVDISRAAQIAKSTVTKYSKKS